MATRQHLINLHGTVAPTAEGLKDKEFKNGELAVQHGADAASSALHILTSGQAELVTFLPKGQDASYLKDADLNQIRKDITDNATVAARGITENNNAITTNADAIGVNTAAIAGLDSRMDTAESEIDALQGKTMVNSFGGKTGEITLDTDASAAKSVKFIMSNNELQGTVMGLGDIVTHQHSEYATSAQGTKADTALQSVAHSTEFSGSGKSDSVLSLADGKIAQSKLNSEVQSLLGKADSALQSISASGDTYISASVSDNQVNVSAAKDLTDAIEKANSAMQSHQNAIKTITLGGDLSGSTTASAAGASVTLNATIKEGQVTNAMLAGGIESIKLNDIPSTKITHENSTVSQEIIDIKAAIKGGTHFKGVLTVKPAVGDYRNGDIIAISGGSSKDEGKEFILTADISEEGVETNKKWVELGDTSAEADRITKLEAKTKDVNTTVGDFVNTTIAELNLPSTYAKKNTENRVDTLEGYFTKGKANTAGTADSANALESAYRTQIITDAQSGKLNDSHASQVATSDTFGHIKIGYTENDKNYPVELDKDKKAFVNVPWVDTPNTDTVTTFAASGDSYITLTHSGSTFTNQKVTAKAGVCTNIASATGTQLADAVAVKSYVDAHDAAVTDHNPTLSWNTKSAVATIDGTAIHVTMPAQPKDNDTPTTIQITGTDKGGEPGQTVTVSGADFTKTIDFSKMIIDCGEY